MRKYIPLTFALVLVAGCENRSILKNAKGETPVKFVICSAGETGCVVSARFGNLEACERHKAWAEMLCDEISTPGQMICRKDRGTQISTAYCTF